MPMKRAILALLFCAASFVSRGAEPAANDGWSETVRGLRARFVFGEGRVDSGTRIPEVYLELDNASDVASPIEFDFDGSKLLHSSFALRTASRWRSPSVSG